MKKDKAEKAEVARVLLSAKDAKAKAADLVGSAVVLKEVPNHGRAAKLKVGTRLEAKAVLECRSRSYVKCVRGEETYTLAPQLVQKVK